MNLLYQCFNGTLLPGNLASSANLREYAHRIGAAYRMDVNANYTRLLCDNQKHFDRLRPVFDSDFWEYERIAYVDLDVFAVDGLGESLFAESCPGFAMAREPDQAAIREHRRKDINGRNDERWARLVAQKWGIVVPRDERGRTVVFNSGVLLFTRDGLKQARKAFLPPQHYIDAVKRAGLPAFYAIDQNYLHAMAFLPGVAFQELSVEWNRQVHLCDDGTTYDRRNADTKFVHVQLRGADHNDADWHHRLVNGTCVHSR